MKEQRRKIEMAYMKQGSGIPVLLIHGYPLSKRVWEPQISGLASIAQIIAPDLHGFGQSNESIPPHDPQPYSMELFAHDCSDLLDELEIYQPVVLNGLSMGGYIAFAFYKLYPQRVRGLILTSTKAGADSLEARANRDKSAELAILQGTNAIVEGMLPKLLAPKTYQESPEVVNEVRSIMTDASIQGITDSLLGMKERQDSVPFLPQISCPTLVIAGAEDQIIPISDTKIMEAKIPDSILTVIEGAGHLPNLEQSDNYNNIVSNFLNTL